MRVSENLFNPVRKQPSVKPPSKPEKTQDEPKSFADILARVKGG